MSSVRFFWIVRKLTSISRQRGCKQFGLRHPLQILNPVSEKADTPNYPLHWLLVIGLTTKGWSWQQYWKRRIGSGSPRSGKVQGETFSKVWKEIICKSHEIIRIWRKGGPGKIMQDSLSSSCIWVGKAILSM